jgi:transposase
MVARLFSDAEEQEFRRRYETGESTIQIATKQRCSDGTIVNAIIRQGGTIRKQPRPNREEAESMRAMYFDKGLDVTEIADRTGWSAGTVYRYVGGKNFLRGRFSRLTEAEELEIVRKYREGTPLTQLGTYSQVRRILDGYGIPVRGPGGQRPRTLTEEQELDVIRLYTEECWSIKQLAEKFSVTEAIIRLALRRVLHELRLGGKQPGRISADEEAEICRRFRAGDPPFFIAPAMRLDVVRVREVLARHGLLEPSHG